MLLEHMCIVADMWRPGCPSSSSMLLLSMVFSAAGAHQHLAVLYACVHALVCCHAYVQLHSV
jgi:hypothetical protein